VILAEEQWQRFSLDGYLELGLVLTSNEVDELRGRAEDFAAGRVHNEHVRVALDAAAVPAGAPGAAMEGTPRYRKIEGLEHDELIRSYLANQLLLEVCARMYAPHAPISVFRATIMNRPAEQGTVLPWHQNGGNSWRLDRDPLVTLWIALDEATVENGCIEAVRGSHHTGLVSLQGRPLSAEDAAIHCDPELVVPLEVKAGHAILLHNWLIHRSSVSRSFAPRRAFSGSLIDGRTLDVTTGSHFPLVAGTIDETPYPYIGQLESDLAAYAESLRLALERATGLESEIAELRERMEAAELRARSLGFEWEGSELARGRSPRGGAKWLRSLFHR
jgi:hypothetical protein